MSAAYVGFEEAVVVAEGHVEHAEAGLGLAELLVGDGEQEVHVLFVLRLQREERFEVLDGRLVPVDHRGGQADDVERVQVLWVLCQHISAQVDRFGVVFVLVGRHHVGDLVVFQRQARFRVHALLAAAFAEDLVQAGVVRGVELRPRYLLGRLHRSLPAVVLDRERQAFGLRGAVPALFRVR